MPHVPGSALQTIESPCNYRSPRRMDHARLCTERNFCCMVGSFDGMVCSFDGMVHVLWRPIHAA